MAYLKDDGKIFVKGSHMVGILNDAQARETCRKELERCLAGEITAGEFMAVLREAVRYTTGV